ncbi:hypothetical protein I79_009171 [Cricetulus griseus]|uniref:Uncharacterized protein n=1 Tax=Cricetulus griseus TaxID=10029 RepID=G3HF19_CRIGR|nr:hypothetical protein I79_009171 [Cricetulus griseus]
MGPTWLGLASKSLQSKASDLSWIDQTPMRQERKVSCKLSCSLPSSLLHSIGSPVCLTTLKTCKTK